MNNLEPIWDTVNRVYDRYVDPPESPTFDEMPAEDEDQMFLREMGEGNDSTY